jgi:hypothetical protein
LRQRIGRTLDQITIGAADSGSLTTLVDAELVDSLESAEFYLGAWVWMSDHYSSIPVTFGERRIQEYVPATGRLTFSRTWDETRSVGLDYEIHRLIRPSVLNDIISQAIKRLTHETTQEITVVDGQRQYDLAAVCVDPDATVWLTDPAQVLEVYWRDGDAGEHIYYPLEWWDVMLIEGVPTLMVPPNSATSSAKLVLHAWRTYRDLDESTALDVHLDWLEALCLAMAYEHLIRHGPAQDTERYQRQMLAEYTRYAQLRKVYAPRPRYRQHLPPGARQGLDSLIVRWK